MPSYPWQNKGAYEWVPDEYGSTSGSIFGVTSAFDNAVVDIGRPQNFLPPKLGYGGRNTRIIASQMRAASGAPIGSVDTDSKIQLNACNPFINKMMKAISPSLLTIPSPSINDGFGMSNSDDGAYYIFTVDEYKISSILIEYVLATSIEASVVNGTPVNIIGLFDPNTVGDTWWNTARSLGEGVWGPPSENSFSDGIAGIASGILGRSLMGIFLPQIIFGDDGAISEPELSVNNPGAYEAKDGPDWSITSTSISVVKTSNDYWTSTDYFPRLVAIAIVPNSNPEWEQQVWNLKVGGIRVYDALQVNAVPEHEEIQSDGTTKIIKAQFPCKIFGYAWRVMHAVHLSGHTTSPIQPPLASYGRPPSTFRFRLYDPDTGGLGIAHGVKFYYLLVALAMPGTSPFGITASLVGVLGGMAADQDLMFVSFSGIMPGRQTMTFIPSASQNTGGVSIGKTVYSGQFAYSRQTIATKCFRAQGVGTSSPPQTGAPVSSSWEDIGISSLPLSIINGTRGLWFDEGGTNSSWYSFLSLNQNTSVTFSGNNPASYVGGFSSAVRGAPRVDVIDKGAFSMSTTFSDSFSGTERITTYAKPAGSLRRSFDAREFCSHSNMISHLGTFVSDELDTGPSKKGAPGYIGSVSMFTGDWRVRFVASVGDTTRDEAYIFFRFAFVDASVDTSTINGSSLWSLPANQIQEFHFNPEIRSDGEFGSWIASGPPSMGSMTSTPITTSTQAYPISWFCPGAKTGDPHASHDSSSQSERLVYMDIPFSNARLVVQAWAVSFPISSPGNAPKDPRVNTFCPAVELSWAGETEASIQTMIMNVKSNAIFAQRDSQISRIDGVMKNFISSYSNNEYVPPQDQSSEFRTWPKYSSTLSVERDRFIPAEDGSGILRLQQLVQLANEATSPSGFSITDLSSSIRYDGSESSAQIVDVAAGVTTAEGGGYATFGGSTIFPQNMNVSFKMMTNNSTFDGFVSVSIFAVSSSGLSAGLIGETMRMAFSTQNNPALSEGGPYSASSVISIPTSITVAGLTSLLMVRFKIWTFSNRNADILSSFTYGSGNDNGFACLDISDFKIECVPVSSSYPAGFPTLTDEQYITGNKNWEMGLPVTTSRTFGANEYQFVPDESSVRGSVSVPATASPYGEWHLDGWMFSPLWFIEMPENSVFEIVDRAGLTLASQNIGNGFSTPEREQRLLRVRTAIDTATSDSLAGMRDNMRWGGDAFVARSSGQISGATSASNFIKITKFSGKMDTDHAVPDFSVRIGETFISGKNPLLVTMRTDNTVTNRRRLSYTPASTQIKYLFYEMDEFDISRSERSRIAMLASYDSYGRKWLDPYAESGSTPSETARVIFTSDMKMLSGVVDTFGFTMYVVGYRSTNPNSPQDGGGIFLRQIQPRLIYDPATAGTGPLQFVDGFLSTDSETNSWNTLAGGGKQPVTPFEHTFSEEPYDAGNLWGGIGGGKTSKWGHTNPNYLGDGETVVPAAESFPDVVVDDNCNVYVMYSLLPLNARVTGKVFCRKSHNGGYWFGQPYPIADLGYEMLSSSNRINFPKDDDSFEVRHITALLDHHSKLYMIFFWAGGKIFMRMIPHPGDPGNRANSIVDEKGYDANNNILYMVAGSTDFTIAGTNSGTALERWLKENWDFGTNSKETGYIYPPNIENYSADWLNQWNDYLYGGINEDNQNNYARGRGLASIRISRYGNDLDISPQRVGAFSTERGDIIMTFLDTRNNLMCKRIRLAGGYPLISPALMIDTSDE